MKISRVVLSISNPIPELIKIKKKVLNKNIKIEIIIVIKIQVIILKAGIIFFNTSKNNQKTKNGKLIIFFTVELFTFFLAFHQNNL